MGIEPNATAIAEHALDDIRAIYERGLYLTAYQKAIAIAPLAKWDSAAARILASRLAGNLGGLRLADWHIIRAYRASPADADARWYFANYLSHVRGPLRAWRFVNEQDLPATATDEQRSHWYSLKGRLLATLRDFDAGDDWLCKAEALGEFVWIAMERATALSYEDRHEEAEEAVRRALERRPWYRPAVQWLAHFLVQRERDDEALALLRDASTRLESAALWIQLHTLLRELELYGEAMHALDEYERHSPLLEPLAQESLAARRGDIAYWGGDWDAAKIHVARAIEFGAAIKGPHRRDMPFTESFSKALNEPKPERTGVALAAPFVRQHFQTCVPATLASICRFWGKEVDHLATAEAITYRGTPQGKERRWAKENGFATKEFTVTWEAATVLLDHGIPFTLTTVEVTSSHLQAVVGYDSVRRSFWIRDPGERHRREFFADKLFERYGSTGPRGMALVPADRADELRALPLPDEALHDRLHRMEIALEIHQRDKAAAEVAALEAEHPDHLATWIGRRMLETYDANVPGMLAITEKMLTRFPKDARLLLAKASFLREMGRREDRLALFAGLVDQKDADPACWQQYAQELADDAREHIRARLYLTKAIRFNFANAANYMALARLLWNQRHFEEAFELDRFALCLEDKDEFLARNYFQSARNLRKTDEALTVLRRRFERFGAKAMLPARTLYFALVELERVEEAMDVLHRALERRPSDGDLIAFVGDSYLARGNFTKAREYFEQAKGLCQPVAWLRSMASLTRQEGDLAGSREYWRQALDAEPLSLDAHRNFAHAAAEIDGRPAAVAHMQAACTRFPHHFQLAQLWLDWLREDPAEVREGVVRRMIDIHPADARARREYILVLTDMRRFDDAYEQAELAEQLDPKNPSLWTTRFYLDSSAGKLAQAKEDCRQALRLSVDLEIAQQDLLSLCDSLEERREALAFIEGELIQQVTFGQGLLHFRSIAQGTLEQDELLAALQKGLDARPDLWHAWAAVIRQLEFMERYDAAVPLAKRAVERFPHLPALWVDLANILRGRRDTAGELEALTRALAISPNWSVAQLALAGAHERAGRLTEARAVFDTAIARAPLVAQNHLALAEFLARHDSKEQAIAVAARALRIDPSAVAAWNRFLEWSIQLNKVPELIAYTRQDTVNRPGEARAWIRLAQALAARPIDPDLAVDRKNVSETIVAYDEVLLRNPYLLDAHDRKASLLAEVTRWDEALAACRPKVFGDQPPVPLAGRAAWIVARRGDVPAAAKAMREVLRRDRNYLWGWRTLADWEQSLGHWQEYLEAADNIVRVNPADAVGRTYRGEAKLRLGRRDEALADLSDACDLSPGYLLPACLLFDEHFAAGELDEAKDALARLKKHAPGDETTVREMRLALRRDETGEALQIFRKLGRASGENPEPLQTAVNILESAGLADKVQQALSDLAADGRSHPFAAVLLCERTPFNSVDFDERLCHLDKSIARIGAKGRALDLKAELLARAGRFDDALAVCNGPKSPDAVLPLAGRSAWARFQRGDHDKAIKSMRRVLAENPSYHWGWSQLALWSEHVGDRNAHLEAAERMLAIAPNDSFAYIERSRARAALGDPSGARADHFSAVRLNPRNTATGLDLINKLLTEGEATAASEIIELLAPHLAPAAADEQRRLVEYAGLSHIERIGRVLTFCAPRYADLNRLGLTFDVGVVIWLVMAAAGLIIAVTVAGIRQ